MVNINQTKLSRWNWFPIFLIGLIKEYVTLAADKLLARLNMDSSVLVDLLLSREKESSTVLNSTLAIPHVVIEG